MTNDPTKDPTVAIRDCLAEIDILHRIAVSRPSLRLFGICLMIG
jgi:hypothetical protein